MKNERNYFLKMLKKNFCDFNLEHGGNGIKLHEICSENQKFRKKVFLIPSFGKLSKAHSAHIKVNNKQQQTFPFSDDKT